MKILDFPEHRQIYDYDCGASALTTVLAYYGIDEREDQIWKIADITKAGTDPRGILRVCGRFNLVVSAYNGMTLDRIRQAIDDNQPVIINLQAWREGDTTPAGTDWSHDFDDGHFAVAIGYDANRIIFSDPASYKWTWLSNTELMLRWHDKSVDGLLWDHWGCIVQGTQKFHSGDMEHMD